MGAIPDYDSPSDDCLLTAQVLHCKLEILAGSVQSVQYFAAAFSF